MSYTVINADVRAGLRQLPENSVHCCVTSPPYWGLRAYQTEPQVWGGSDPECEHVWGAELPKPGSEYREGLSTSIFDGREDKAELRSSFRRDKAACLPMSTGGQYCQLCGAWRGELGSEPTPEQFAANIVEVFREVKRVLRKDGVCYMNIGDSYAASTRGSSGVGKNATNNGSILEERQWSIPLGLKPKDLVGIPWRVAFALQADGWWLRSDIIWAKNNPMPESCTDRPTKSHEYVFMLTKSARYFYDSEAVKEKGSGRCPGNRHYKYDGLKGHETKHGILAQADVPQINRNLRTVWTIPTEANSYAHYATYPRKLVTPCVKAATSEHGCCSKCGAPRERIVEKTGGTIGTGGWSYDQEKVGTQVARNRGKDIKDYSVKTVGWTPTCACNAEIVPCTVLDPFSGSGTSGVVALELGRSYIGVELNPKDSEHSRKRLAKVCPLFA